MRLGVISVLAASLGVACGGASGETPPPVTPASAPSPAPAVAASLPPSAAPVAPAPEASSQPSSASSAPAGSAPAGTAPAAASPAPPRPGSLVAGGLARGSGEPWDQEVVLADVAYRAGDFAAAKAHYGEARKLAPKEAAPKVGVIRSRIALRGTSMDYGAAPKDPEVKALLAELDGVIRASPEYGPAYVERGRLLLVQGKADPALAALERGAALAADDPEAQSALGVALLATGKADQALGRLKRAAELDPDDPERLTNLGTVLLIRGQVADALVAFRRAVDLVPNDARALSDLGTAYLAANRAADAKPYLERAVAADPRATFLSNLGYAEQQLGDVAGAVATLQKALDKDPKLASAWLNLGSAFVALGRLDDAERAFKKAGALDPTDPRPKASLGDLAEIRKNAGK
ncbi:MAG TPA: tetratricopeptide repeat protein [Polyangiaceae bacterium]|nr:tetratricopeptide repeat protein [Polyangiaceae bacterium]